MATPGGRWKDMVPSKMTTGWDRDLRNNYTIFQRGLFFVFGFGFYTMCLGTVSDMQFYKPPAPDTRDTWPMAVTTQWAWGSRVIHRGKGALKVSCFPRSVGNLNRKRWRYSSYLWKQQQFKLWYRVSYFFKLLSDIMVDVFQVEVQVMLLQAGWVLAEWLLKYPYSEFEGVSGRAKQRPYSCWKVKAEPWHWLLGMNQISQSCPLCRQKEPCSVIISEPLFLFQQ